MRTLWWCVFAALALLAGCEEQTEPAEPEAIAPEEVTSDEDEPGTQTVAAEGDTDVEALEARVAELERQVAARDGTATAPAAEPAGGTHVATVPDGVDVPSQEEATPAGSSTATSGSGSNQRTGRRTGSRRPTDTRAPDLLGALLGDGEREQRTRTRRGDEEEDEENNGSGRGGSLNPVDILGL